jgi:predicted amidohydrolase
MRPLSIAVAQPPCVPYDVATNVATHAATVRSAGARVVVFPELSLTGYELDAATLAADDRRLGPLVDACAGTHSLALVGAPLAGEAGRSHIGMLAVDGVGVTVAYHKLYLSTTEAERFCPGRAPVALDVDDWRLGLAICKDTSIPRHAADTVALSIDAYVAATLMFTDEAELQNERARRLASRYQVAVAVASFAGPTGGGYDASAGGSGIWSVDGSVLAQAGSEPGAIACAALGTHAARRGVSARA